MDIGFTSKLEEQLDAVADGKMSRDELVHGFYNNFSKSLEKFEKKKLERAHEETDFLCGEDGCVGKLIVKVGKTGEFLGCSRYPDCKFTCNFKRNEQGVIEKEEQKKDEQLDLTCPTCGKNLAKKHGRFGEFIACSGYPECKYIHKEKTKALCPECYKDGLVKRKWKNNIFWSCGSYPACKFGISADIIEQECPECKFPFLKKIGKGGIAFSCAGNTPKNPCSFVIEEK
jgi:DNA topoisomerase-1